MMMHSETPWIASRLEKREASNWGLADGSHSASILTKWSVVFSKLASIRTESFIFETPKRVIPSTSP